jgi:ribosomal protein S18 acetylase RimI-like enzyme
MHIVAVDKPESWVLEGLNALLPQLSDHAAPLTAEALALIVASPCTSLLIAAEKDQVLGTLTLATFRIPMGVRARIEDVVVDASARRQGLAELLIRRALEMAGDKGADAVDLTSGPLRRAANRLYRKLGFVARDTNAYQYIIARP